MIIFPGFSFIFPNFWFFGLLVGSKGKNDKKLCHLCSISQESFIIWSWLVVHKLNMMISLGVFFIFSKPWFFSLLGGSKGKKWLKTTKTLSVVPYISGTIHHMIVIFGAHVWNDDISRCCFHFFKILVFHVVMGVKGKKMAQNDKAFCLPCSLSQKPYLIWLWFSVHMCKMMISPAIIFIFLKFWFFGVLGGREWKGKKWSIITSFSLSHFICQEL